jgi:hypothetical protein
MNENRFTAADWEQLHEEIQKRLRGLADEVCAMASWVKPRFSKTVTEVIPLFSYVSFRRPEVGEGEYIIVGADVIPQNGQWRIDADIADEEGGTIYFELPNAPFSVSSFAELRAHVLATTDELIARGKPVLLRLFGTPAPVVASQAASLPEVARKV